jgi:hypothetical protein
VSDAGVKSSTVGAVTLTGGAIGAGVGLGTIGTAASIGAITGSAVPVVGTIIGAIAGALIGVIAGAVVTEAVDAAQTQEGVERKVTGGLTQKEFSDFAVAAQQSGLYVSGENAADEEKFRNMYIKKYGSEEGWSDVWDSITEMGNKFDELGAKTEALRLA